MIRTLCRFFLQTTQFFSVAWEFVSLLNGSPFRCPVPWWFSIQIIIWLTDSYSDHFEYRSAIQMSGTMVPCICYSDVSAIQMFPLFRSPTVFCKMLSVSSLKLRYNRAIINCLFISDNQQKNGKANRNLDRKRVKLGSLSPPYKILKKWLLHRFVGRPVWSLLNDVTWIPFLLSYFTCTYRFSSVPYQTSLFIIVLYIYRHHVKLSCNQMFTMAWILDRTVCLSGHCIFHAEE